MTVKASEAEETLKFLREAVLGFHQLRKGEAEEEIRAYAALAIFHSMRILDLFLTGEHQERDREIDLYRVSTFLAGGEEALFLLSDKATYLKVRWPTEEDPRVVYPLWKESTPLDVRRRWIRVDNRDSEASEFPNEVTYGRA